ncbi:MAG: hypothetical protein R3E84_06950 [Pseudomonadales bacterium]
MKSGLMVRTALAVAMVGALSACGGGSSNASPGAVVVTVPVDNSGNNNGGGTDNGGGNNNGGGNTGNTVSSTIPSALASVITDSGTTTSAAFGSKSIYTIDVSALTNGQFDPTGLVLGNDHVFEISGGALRVTPPTGSAAASGPDKSLDNPGSDQSTVTVTALPACQLKLSPGSVIVGDTSSDFLVIEQGCAIVAEGTATQPIIFTAKAEVTGNVEPGDRGLWGGVVINGRAPINDCPEGATGGTDQCTKEGEANSGTFGGSDPHDNSGVLKYVSVRYAGSNVDPENQLNGIAFQGVGDETVVDYVQVHNNLDDGIEMFGGTVNLKHVVLTGNADDSLDWTDGWTGKVQYLYLEQATDSGDNLIEADNREGDEDVLPRSNPTIANMTALGRSASNGLRLRRGTGATIANSFVDGSATCLRVDGSSSRGRLGTDIVFEGVSLACAQTHASDTDGAVAAYLAGATNVSSDGSSVDPVTLSDTFFETADQIGAFGATNWAAGWTLAGSVSQPNQADFGCPAGTATSTRTINSKRVCQLSGTITQNILLTSNNLYELIGKVVVGGDNTSSAVLTLQAGTTVFGGTDTDFLVISRGSQIVANGTRLAPVTFTSQSDLEGQADLASTRGEWGGVVINGNAPINDCPEGATGGTTACTKEGEANSGLFGGDDPTDNSGVLNYVVVKFAGSNVDPENQLNGIAFQGVGSGTQVDYVQVHNNLDDGIEMFGGTVNMKHVVLTGNADDSLDWTDGWQGSVQYLIINQASDDGDKGIEADNREGDETVLPRSLPRIANMTMNARESTTALHLRRGTGLELYNSVVQGSAFCLRVQGDSLNQLGTGIQFGGVTFDCATVVQGDDVPTITALLEDANVSLTGQQVTAEDLTGDSFFETTTYIGAIENAENDWTAGWTVGNPSAATDFECPTGTTEIASVGDRRTCQLSGTITQDLTLPRSNYYVLNGKVTVGGDNTNSAALTIESGTTIIGDDSEDFLVISRGSQIFVNGTANAPVTMTALADVNNTIADPVNTQGLWGGLVLNGNAPINDCPEGVDGGTVACTKEGEANSGLFGGADPEDSSGRLKYLVVKFAGSNVDPENQLNGIAFQGIGSGTEVDFIEVYNNLDDGVEFFGGTVNVSHVVLIGNADDGLDWTDGWRGRAQYVYIRQTGNTGDNTIEADNREGDERVTPISEPRIANMTGIGHSTANALRLRRGTGVHLFNTQISGAATCVRVQGESLNLLGTLIEFAGVGLNCATVNNGDDVTAVQDFLDASTNVEEGATTPTPIILPAEFDAAGSTVIGSDIGNWGANWTVGVN